MHKKEKSGKEFICSTFNNSRELVTIYHDSHGIYQQHWQTGNVEYKTRDEAIKDKFNESEYELSNIEVGHVIDSVWRPGLCLDIPKALNIQETEKNRAKKDLKILIEKLHNILLYVEPDENGLKTYSHKIRELLILASTEIENTWTYYFRIAGNQSDRLNTNDYVKLCDKLRLQEYKVTFISHPISIELQPFLNWTELKPTNSIPWYNAYNKTKHNKSEAFSEAKLKYCLDAIAANITMLAVRYSPYEILEKNDICSNLIKENFEIEIIEPKLDSFYIPLIKSVEMASGAFSGPKGSNFESEWIIDPFSI